MINGGECMDLKGVYMRDMAQKVGKERIRH